MVGTKRTRKVTAPRNDDRCRQKKQQLVTVAHVYASVRRQLLAPGYWLVETSDRLHAVKQEEEYDDDGFKVGFSPSIMSVRCIVRSHGCSPGMLLRSTSALDATLREGGA